MARVKRAKTAQHPLSANIRMRKALLQLSTAKVAQALRVRDAQMIKIEQGNFVFVDPDGLNEVAYLLQTTPNDLLEYEAFRRKRQAQTTPHAEEHVSHEATHTDGALADL